MGIRKKLKKVIPKEKYSPIIYNGKETGYFISNLGNVYSKKRGYFHQLMPAQDSGGYQRVALYINKKLITFKVHRLVATAFIKNPSNKPHVNHIDGNKRNNTSENLEWVTQQENNVHAITTGLRKMPQGEQSVHSTVSNATIIKLCELLESTDAPLSSISTALKISPKIVYSVYNGNSWLSISKKYNFQRNRKNGNLNGKKPRASKYGENNIRKTCEMLENGKTVEEILKETGLPFNVVRDIKRRKGYKSISKDYSF